MLLFRHIKDLIHILMLDLLFITRRNSHGKYFKKLSENMTINSAVHYYGLAYLPALKKRQYWSKFELDNIIERQLIKKIHNHPFLFRPTFVKNCYRIFSTFAEKLRVIKYIALLSKLQPHAIALWNGNKLPSETVALVAKHLGITVWHFENGIVPNTTTLDAKGVNALNSLPRTPAFYLNQVLKDIDFPEIGIRKAHKKRASQEIIDLPEKYIFVPFQVPNDTQIIVNSSWVKSMEVFFNEVSNAFLQNTDESTTLVFKEHPSWPQHFEELYETNERIKFANGNPTPDLIANALAVVTINSSVGLESLLQGKPVITLGDACYNIKGLVRHASNSDELCKLMQTIESWKPDETLRIKFLQYLYDCYCIPTSWAKCDEKNIRAVEKRILKQDCMNKL